MGRLHFTLGSGGEGARGTASADTVATLRGGIVGNPMKKSRPRTNRIFAVPAVAALLIGVAVPASLLIWQAVSSSVVMLEGSAGTLMSTTIDRSIFPAETLTQVETSIGNVEVHGPFSGVRGSPLVVERLNKAPSLRLCIAGEHATCAQLAGAWASILTPTAAAGNAVDFPYYGLSTENLWTWFGLGVLMLVLVIVVGGITRLARSNVGAEDENEELGAANH